MQEGEGGGVRVHSTALHRQTKNNNNKKKCSEKLNQSAVAAHRPPAASPTAPPDGAAASCVLVFARVFLSVWELFEDSSQACDTAATDVAACPLLKKEEPRWRVCPHPRSRLPVTWPWPPGSSVVCGRWTRPVKTGQSRRWCWSR